MSVRAYRINKIEREKGKSFNLWHDEELVKFLDNETGFFRKLDMDCCGVTEASVEKLKRALEEVRLEDDVREQIEKDIKWAEANEEEWIQYYCL